MHPVTLVAFPLASHHPAPSSLHLVNILLVNSTYVLKLDYGGSCKSCPFHIVDADGPTILGLPTSKDLNLVTMNFSITNHKGLPGQAPHLDLSVTQIQLLKSGCSKSLSIALKVLVAFRVNIALQLILPFPQSCTLHEEFQRPSGSPWRRNLFHWLSKESWQNLPSV